jgi:hypothetical protein
MVLNKDSEIKENPCVGVDVGTSNICVCRQQTDGNFSVKHYRNMLFELEATEEADDLLSRSDYLYLKSDDRYYIVGDDALKLVNAIGKGEIIRPMQDGLLNPNLKRAQNLLNYILEAVLGKPLVAGENLRYSVPGNPVDRPEMNNLFHQMVLAEFFKRLGYSPKPINEALANLYNEAPTMEVEGEGTYPLTGYSISFGGGMMNCCFALRGMSIVDFSSTKCGDYIDKQASTVTGTSVGRVIRIKEKNLDLNKVDSDDPVQQALSIYYDEMIYRVIRNIGKELAKKTHTVDGAVEVVICGGTAMAPGFIGRVKGVLERIELPFKVKDVRLSGTPFYSVSQGACLAAQSDSEKAKDSEKVKVD